MATAETKMDMSLDDVIKASKQQSKKTTAPKAKAGNATPGKATPKKGAKGGKSPAKAVPVKSPAQKGKKGGKQAVVKAVTASASAKRQAALAKKRGLGVAVQMQTNKNAKKRGMAVAVRPTLQVAVGKKKGPKGQINTPARGARKAPAAKASVAGGRQQLLDNLSPAPIPKAPMQIRIVNNAAGAAKARQPPVQVAKAKPAPRAPPPRPAPKKKQPPPRARFNAAGAVMMANQNGLMVAQRQNMPVQYMMVPVNQAKAVVAKKKQPPPRKAPPPQRKAPPPRAQPKAKPQGRKGLVAAGGSGRPVMPGDVLAAQNGGRKSPAPRLGVQKGGVAKGKGGVGLPLNRRFSGTKKR